MPLDPTYDLPGQIVRIVDTMDEATNAFAEASQRAAIAEAKYRYAHATATVDLAGNVLNAKMTVAHREAHAMLRARHEYEAYMITAAAADAAKQHLYTLRAKLDALRALNANVRMLTDPRLPT